MGKVYIYVVDRDFGFAPNPFHSRCTLATCKPGIRKGAQIGDWVIGMGGGRLKATGRCVFGMRVTGSESFSGYWSNPVYGDKRPVRNGSRRMMVGDNIYHRDPDTGVWHQADSHHSNADGTPDAQNIANDTSTDRVLISDHFYYFGRAAPEVPDQLLNGLGFRNARNYRVFDQVRCADVLNWLEQSFKSSLKLLVADPFDFAISDKRYSARDNKIR